LNKICIMHMSSSAHLGKLLNGLSIVVFISVLTWLKDNLKCDPGPKMFWDKILENV